MGQWWASFGDVITSGLLLNQRISPWKYCVYSRLETKQGLLLSGDQAGFQSPSCPEVSRVTQVPAVVVGDIQFEIAVAVGGESEVLSVRR